MKPSVLRARIPLRALALCLVACIAGCGEESKDDPASAPTVVGTRGKFSDEPLVPLSGSHPAHVVGASTFSRFHLLTAEDGFAKDAQEDMAEGVEDAAAGAVRALDAQADALRAAGKIRAAAQAFVAAAVAAQKAGWVHREERCRLRALGCYARLDEPVEMLALLRRVLELRRQRKDGLASTRTEADLGCVYGILANYDRALDHLGAAAQAFGKYGLRRSEAEALASMGIVDQRRSEYGPALDLLDRAQGLLADTRSKPGKAFVLNALGNVYANLGDMDRAEALYREAEGLHGKGASVDKADVLGNLGSVQFHRGAYEDALAHYGEAQRIFEAAGDAKGRADALFSMGRVRKIQGGYRTALEIYHQALELQERESPAAARTHCAVAETYLAMGRADDAMDEIDAAMDGVRAGSAPMVEVELLVVHALAHLARKEPDRAVDRIRRALDLLMEVTAGLADEHVVGLREYRGWVFDAGIAVALRTGRVDLAAEFIEHGRAGALLEALGARGARRGIPPELVEAETLAAHRVARANRAYQEARGARRLDALRGADEELAEARAAYRAIMQRVQRASKRAASVFHPVPDSLAAMQTQVFAGDALVLYALLPFQAYALVLTPERARIVWLGNTDVIREACETLRADAADDGPEVVEARLRLLRRLVLDPLALPSTTRRLLLCPDGPLCYVPFPLLVGEAEIDVACLPSGTTLRLLRAEAARTGRGVLALGDPQYRIEHQGRSLQVYAEGVPLESLPATRLEVTSITGPEDMRLLGSYATVGGLAEVASTRERWSAIHLACHGLIDPRTPTLSALALTPDARDDGFLTALEVYGMSLPADLVVLSGCNTGRGRFMKGEGLVGLMRAFMCAGTPRIVVSLWKVDDRATQALMTRFHALWRAGGLAAPEALRRAQAEIRGQPDWAHPRYWGAWVLWGLAD